MSSPARLSPEHHEVLANPYPGPRPFTDKDQNIFFGREWETRDLLALVISNRVLHVCSQSGVGKTSLIQAGVLPLLVPRPDFETLPVARVGRPVSQLMKGNCNNIYTLTTLTCWSDPFSTSDFDGRHLVEQTIATYLAKKDRKVHKGKNVARVMIFDQFEEIFFTYPDHWRERSKFFEQIREALDQDPLLKVLFVLREDYLAELDPFSEIVPDGFGIRFRLERLTRDAALRAIKRPLEHTGRSFAKGVAEKLVRDLATERIQTGDKLTQVTGQYVEPVQLQVVCHNLWHSNATQITFKELRHKVSGALSDFYADVVRRTAHIANVNEQRLREACEGYLITSIGTRNKVYQDEWAKAIPETAIQELRRNYLIQGQYDKGTLWYELTHDLFVKAIRASNKTYFREGARANQQHGEVTEKVRRITEAVQQTCPDARTFENPFEIFRAIVDQIRSDLPFDLCTVTMFSRDKKYARVLFQYPGVLDLGTGDAGGFTRWYRIPKLFKWVDTHEISMVDVAELLSEYIPENAKEQAQKDSFVQQKYVSLIRYPIVRGNRVVASMTLWSKTHQYVQGDRELFEALPVEAALLSALYYQETDELRFRIDLLKDLVECGDNRNITGMLVERIAKHYGWRNVAMYRVDERRGNFELQSHWPPDVLPARHSQPMHTGILGLAYEEGDQNIPNVRDPKYSSLYVKAYEEAQSELCMRIKEHNKVIGLLNIEDPRDNAFSRDEELALRELLDVVGKVMERIMIANLVNATFEATVTAVFVTDGSDNISIVSPSAVQLLGFTTKQMKGRPIETYLPEALQLKELCRRRKVQSRPATLRHKNGCSIDVLLSASRLGGESDGMVFSAQKPPGSD